MSADATPAVLVRARLRRDVPATALARILVPEQPGAQIGAAHSLVWALFAREPDRRRDFLWRQTRPGEFLILAARPPSDAHGLFALEWKPFAPTLRPGQRLQFDLRANPVVGVARGRGLRGKRNDVVMHALATLSRAAEREMPTDATAAVSRPALRERAVRDAGTAWLARQGETAGFSADPERLRLDGYDRVRIPREDSRSAIVFSVLQFQGILTVRDPDRFLRRVLGGFGSARAFGCGLMLICRAR